MSLNGKQWWSRNSGGLAKADRDDEIASQAIWTTAIERLLGITVVTTFD